MQWTRSLYFDKSLTAENIKWYAITIPCWPKWCVGSLMHVDVPCLHLLYLSGSTAGGPIHHQPPPSLPSPHPLLSPHHPHPSLLSPTGSLGMGLPPMVPGLDPRVFDRGLQQTFLPHGLMGMGLGPMIPGDGLPHMDLSALTAAAALDKVNQERTKKKSKK